MFDYSWIQKPSSEGLGPWFECAMIGKCRPLFDDFDSNYEVEELLVRYGLVEEHMCDSESSALVINFDTVHEGRTFVDRLNAFLNELESGRIKP